MKNDVIHWKVWDPQFNQEEAWPKQEFPRASLHYMKEAGCLVVALAILIRLYGVEKEADTEKFNPWILCQKLKQIKAFSEEGDLEIETVQDLYPVSYLGACDYTFEKLAECLADGEMCLVMVDGVHDAYHFVVVVRICDDDVEIIDGGWDYPMLSCFRHKYEIYRFRRLEEMAPQL